MPAGPVHVKDSSLSWLCPSERSVRHLLSVSARNLNSTRSLDLVSADGDLVLELLELPPPAHARAQLRAATGGLVRVELRAQTVPGAPPRDERPLFVSPVAYRTLNPTWPVDVDALPRRARSQRGVRVYLFSSVQNVLARSIMLCVHDVRVCLSSLQFP